MAYSQNRDLSFHIKSLADEEIDRPVMNWALQMPKFYTDF